MRRYLKHSLILHAGLLFLLVAVTYLIPGNSQKHIQLVILPKGTSLDAVMTIEAEEAMKNLKNDAPAAPTPEPKEKTAAPPPTETPVASLPPLAHTMPEPSPTPAKLATPAPTATPAPVPQKTVAVTPKSTHKAAPNATHKPNAKSTQVPTPTPFAKKSPAAKSVKSPIAKPTATRAAVASAYDIHDGGVKGDNRLAGMNLPRQAPSNVKADEVRPGQEIGVPGVPEGVEGASLPLERAGNMLSMLYTTRIRMKIQSNFTVPPGVNDPNLVCVVEWEILPDGTIQNINVIKSTGTPQYDSCAIDALCKTANAGPLPPELGSRSVWTSLTFVFSGDDKPAAPAVRP
ncbi:MAG: TonB family protein [bacterium]